MTELEQEIAHLQKLRAKHRKNIYTLEEQLANYSIEQPLHLLNKMEFEREQLRRVEERLAELAARTGTEEVPTALTELVRPPQVPPRVTVREPKMIHIPASEFLMGTLEADVDATAREHSIEPKYIEREIPRHEVFVREFEIGKYPVTNLEYQAFVKDTGHEPPRRWKGDQYPERMDDHPVVYVTWHDAVAYCKWLSEKTGKSYRLPSEAEWERAARGTDAREFPWGNEWDANKCNSKEGGPGTTTPVGQYSPHGDSLYGVVDMAGNAWEWCDDWLRAYQGNSFPDEDYGETYKVLRGGSWDHGQAGARCAYRGWFQPKRREKDVGFRCARSSPDAPPQRTPAKPRRPVNWDKVGAIAQVIGVLLAVIGVPIALGTWLWPNAADFFARPSETPTVTPTSSPTHTPVTSTATLTSTPFTPIATSIFTPTSPTPVPPTATPVVPTPTPVVVVVATPQKPTATPMPVQAYALPLSEPFDLVHDGSDLYALFQYHLVKLELLEAEGRFRAAEHQPDFSPANSLTWDKSRGEYWAVRDAPGWVGEEIDLIDRAGNRTATFTVPQTFAGYPRFLAWNGEYLWVTSNEGSLYKVQPAGAGGELKVIDSYAPAIDRYGLREAAGLTWDGNHLWLLVGDVLSKLDQVAQPICKIELPFGFPQPSWYGWRGLAWDGQFVWVVHRDTNKVYRVDPNTCR